MKKRINVLLTAAFCLFAFVGCGMSEEAQTVQDMINQLPETYAADADEDITAARSAYDGLSDEDKEDIDVQCLENLEDARNQHLANEMNEKIDALSIETESAGKLKNSRNNLAKIMEEIEQIPESINDLIHYDSLLEKIDALSSAYTTIITNADNDINAMNDMYEKIDSIYAARSASTKYSLACDIAADISKLSSKWSSSKSKLKSAADDLKDTCLYGEDYEIPISVLNLLNADDVSKSISNYYSPFLNLDSGIVDDCLSWKQTINKRIEE